MSTGARGTQAVLTLLLLLSAACNVGPKYRVPAVPAPPAFTEAPPAAFAESQEWKTAAPGDAAAKGKWWEAFRDQELNALEEQVDVDNQNLKSAAARFEQARALVQVRRADRLPEAGAGASITHARISANRAVPVPPADNPAGDFSLGLQASWEPDLWGRIRNQVAAAVQNAQAVAADVENARLSLHAELALDYFDLRTLDEERTILENAVDAYQKALELTESRYRGGVANRVEVAEARTQWEATRAQAIDVTDLRAQLQHAIAVLTGRPPEGFAVAARAGAVSLRGRRAARRGGQQRGGFCHRGVLSARPAGRGDGPGRQQHHQLAELAGAAVGHRAFGGADPVRRGAAAVRSAGIYGQLRCAGSGIPAERADGVSAGGRPPVVAADPGNGGAAAAEGGGIRAGVGELVVESV